jgi:hypothetical protein
VKVFDAGVEASGIIAVGQFASGVVAFGQVATGVIAVGQLARGIFAFGQLAVGVVAIGQLGVGLAYGAGQLGFGLLAGGMVPVGLMGRLPLRSLRRGRWELERSELSAWKLIVLLAVAALVAVVAFGPLWSMFEAGFSEAPPARR